MRVPKLNKVQHFIFGMGVLLVITSGLFPNWCAKDPPNADFQIMEFGRHFLFTGPPRNDGIWIDTSGMFSDWITLAMVTGVLLLFTRSKLDQPDPHLGHSSI